MQISNLRPEDQLLIFFARPWLNEVAADKMRVLLREGTLDWEYVLAQAQRHGVAGLVWRHLQSLDGALVPAKVLSFLQTADQLNSERCLWLAGELVKVTAALHRAGIPSAPFKGPTLALAAYGDVGLRRFEDLDFFVRTRDVTRAKEVLATHGFVPAKKLSNGHEAASLRFDNAIAFVNAQNVLLDVHWRFAPAYLCWRLEMDELWDRLESVSIGGHLVYTLSTEDLVLVLCGHGLAHQWERLGWICDVAHLIERCRENLDWTYVFATAEQLGVLRIVLLGLLLADELLDARLPPKVCERLDGEAEVREAAAEIAEQLFSTGPNQKGLRRAIRQQVQLRERGRDRIKGLLATVLMPREYDWMFVAVPGALWPLYYLIRPIRWATRKGRNLVLKNSP